MDRSVEEIWQAPLDEKPNPIAHARACLIGIVLFSLFVRLLWIKTPVVRDEGVMAYDAMVWSRGLTPYTYPMAATTPPIGYLIYLIPIQLFGNTIIPVRIINDAMFAISIVLLYLTARNWYDEKVGLVSALFYGLFMNAPIFETHLAIASSLSIPFIVASIFSLSVYLKNSRKSALFLSGLLMSVSSLILQYQALGIILLVVLLAHSKYKASKQHKETRISLLRNLVSSFSILGIGVFLPIFAVVVYVWNYGSLSILIQSTVLRFLAPGYVGAPDVPSSVPFLIFVEAIPLWLFSIAGLVWCSLRKKTYDIFLIAWTVFFIVIAIPNSHFGRHFSQLVPQASLLSGVAITSILGENRLKLTLKRLRDSTDNAKKNATAIFFIVTLAVSFVPALYFQSIQYPNTNFSLFNQTMEYTFSGSWAQQQEIVDYIVSHAGNGNILIHGWEGELYWLSGYLAPDMRWTSSYRSAVPDITDEEYEKILSSVKAGDFELVILMTGFSPDEIMRSVPEYYFFVKSIGLYAIYSKYNAEGYRIEYNFADNLSQALQKYTLDNGTQGDLKDLFDAQTYLPVVEELTINNDSRVAIKQHPVANIDSHAVESNLIYGNISISPHSELSFGVGMDPYVWNKTDGVTFKILVQDDTGTHEIFSYNNNPNENVQDRKWQDYLLDLNGFSGENVSVYFVTNPGPSGSNAYDWAYWSQPLVVESSSARA